MSHVIFSFAYLYLFVPIQFSWYHNKYYYHGLIRKQTCNTLSESHTYFSNSCSKIFIDKNNIKFIMVMDFEYCFMSLIFYDSCFHIQHL